MGNRKLSDAQLATRRVQAGEAITALFDKPETFIQSVSKVTRWDDQPGSTNEVRALRASVANIENTRQVSDQDYVTIWVLLPVIWAMTEDRNLPRCVRKPDGKCPPWYEALLGEFDDATEGKPRRYIFYHHARSHTPGGKAINPLNKLRELVSQSAPSNTIAPSIANTLQTHKRRPKAPPAQPPKSDALAFDDDVYEIEQEDAMRARKTARMTDDVLPADVMPANMPIDATSTNEPSTAAQAFGDAAPSMSYLQNQMPAMPAVPSTSAPVTPTKQHFGNVQPTPVTPTKRSFSTMADQPSSSPTSKSPYVSRDKYNAKSREAEKWHEKSRVNAEARQSAQALADLTNERANQLQREVNDLRAELQHLKGVGPDGQLRKNYDLVMKQRAAMISAGEAWSDDITKVRDMHLAMRNQFNTLADEMAKRLDALVERGNIFKDARIKKSQSATAQPTNQPTVQPPVQPAVQPVPKPPQATQTPNQPAEEDVDDDESDPLEDNEP